MAEFSFGSVLHFLPRGFRQANHEKESLMIPRDSNVSRCCIFIRTEGSLDRIKFKKTIRGIGDLKQNMKIIALLL
jgi:hypothetical protein